LNVVDNIRAHSHCSHINALARNYSLIRSQNALNWNEENHEQNSSSLPLLSSSSLLLLLLLLLASALMTMMMTIVVVLAKTVHRCSEMISSLFDDWKFLLHLYFHRPRLMMVVHAMMNHCYWLMLNYFRHRNRVRLQECCHHDQCSNDDDVLVDWLSFLLNVYSRSVRLLNDFHSNMFK
jgi:hypothetical protein